MSDLKDKKESSLDLVKSKGEAIFQVAGQEVRLNFDIVKRYLIRGSENVSDADLVQFISLCKFNQLNPFLNEAYLVKYGSKPATMVVTKEAFLKRADASDNYDGLQAGVIVLRNGECLELEGSFYLPTDTLVGGWAKVYRSDMKFPFISKVRLEEYDKKQSTWVEIKSTMICKVAKVQALREAFPAQLGAMYTPEEVHAQDANFEDVSDRKNKDAVIIQTESTETQTEIVNESEKFTM